jgi:magnesium transporter
MTAEHAIDTLNRSFLRDYPREAAREIETLAAESVAPTLAEQPAAVLAGVWEHLLPETAEELLLRLPDTVATELLTALDPARVAALLDRLEQEERERYLGALDGPVAQEVRQLLEYPVDSAGRLMDARVTALRGEMTAAEALDRLRRTRRPGRVRFVFLVDEEGRLEAAVDLQDLALADGDAPLRALAQPAAAAVSALQPREEIAARLEQFRLEELPVVDAHGHLLGVIRSEILLQTLQDETSADLQAMVGVGREERALSPVNLAVRKRLLWMEINLVTAFLAASVVGLFESTIAQFTALAVLLPVVAGQSGNAGAQALAVTMRGLALREIGMRQWLRLLFKELRVGLFNGIVIALTTALGVYVWSGSEGLALVIALAMVLSMSIACAAGAMVPIVLTRLGQDPAQSSSIILTTVTDIAGFFSFLGIATLLAALLVAG